DVARADLRRQLGTLDDTFVLRGSIGVEPPPADADALREAALRQRPDIQSRQAAVAEAAARWKLEVAHRLGTPSPGPAFEYNETRNYFIGVSLQTPIPVINTHRGEIQQRYAELQRARQELMQFEVQAQQEVVGALPRLADARAWAENYRTEV